MKKKFIYSFMIAAAAAAFSSCSNFLEVRPQSVLQTRLMRRPRSKALRWSM